MKPSPSRLKRTKAAMNQLGRSPTLGKEAATDQLEAPETAMAADDVRWLNGVNHQLRPDATEQRLAASVAAAAKRKAAAMTVEERKVKRRTDQQRRRAEEKTADGECLRTLDEDARREREAESMIDDELVIPEEGACEEEWRDYVRKVLWRELGCAATDDEVLAEYLRQRPPCAIPEEGADEEAWLAYYRDVLRRERLEGRHSPMAGSLEVM